MAPGWDWPLSRYQDAAKTYFVPENIFVCVTRKALQTFSNQERAIPETISALPLKLPLWVHFAAVVCIQSELVMRDWVGMMSIFARILFQDHFLCFCFLFSVL